MEESEKIIEYLNGQLSSEDLETFLADLKTNQKLAEELDFARNLQFALNYDDWSQMNKKIRDIELPKLPKWQTKLPEWYNRFKYWGAGGLGLAAVVLLYFFNITPMDKFTTRQETQEIQKIISTDEKWNIDLYSSFEDTSKDNKKGMYYYKKSEEDATTTSARKAISLLESYLKKNPKNIEAKLYLGAAYVKTREPIKAKDMLEPLAKGITSDSSDPLTHERINIAPSAQWLLFLIYLHEGNKTKANEWFLKLKNDPTYGVRGKNLLKKIKDNINVKILDSID